MTRVTGEWLNIPATQAVMELFETAGHQVFFVGGCVRNALLGAPLNDIDLATDALPERSMELAQSAGFKAIPTGIDHGTITIVADGIPLEVTTFRADHETDGRHATVRYSSDPKEDALRRDFTMNGLYADRSGEVHDWVDGLADVQSQRVRFIGDPDARITEDYLRILRFFRFHAWYGDPAQGIDADGLAACSAGQDGMKQLSAERIGAEMTKLLSAADPAPSVAAMAQTGILARVLPGSDDTALAPLVHLEGALSPSWLRRAAILGGETPDEAWRLSKRDARALAVLRSKLGTAETAATLGYRFGLQTAIDVILCRAAVLEMPLPNEFLKDAERGSNAKFPVKSGDLSGIKGPALGTKLRALEEIWIDSDFALTRDALLAL